jgi:predicted transcriptional regulator
MRKEGLYMNTAEKVMTEEEKARQELRDFVNAGLKDMEEGRVISLEEFIKELNLEFCGKLI